MIKIWSEMRVARLKEQAADLLTLVWVVFWGNIVWQLFQFLSSFAEAGRTVHGGGVTMIQGGRDLGHLPLGQEPIGDSALVEDLDGA